VIAAPTNIAVAPHAGAWIETKEDAARAYNDKVAPHAGAWIETTGSRPVLD